MEFWKNDLGAPKCIVAPMVDASELAWRMLCRKYGAELCYTPMIHSAMFCKDSKYRKDALASCNEDKPLIIQFCGNDPHIMLEAALLAQDHCVAIDINLGCPQAIAKRGHYGAFLQDEWPLLKDIVSTLCLNVKVPITCKIRVFEDMAKTVEYAKMLEAAGAKILTVHGRTKEQKGPLTGLANWDYVRAVKESVGIPVFSNGNIQCMQDLERCLKETNAQGVMTAEGNLYNPLLFMKIFPPCWQPALEYLELTELYPCPLSYIRGHLFKLFHHILSLDGNNNLRIELGAANTLSEFKRIVGVIKDKYLPYHEGFQIWIKTTEDQTQNLVLPPWLCQPYVRIPPEQHIKLVQEKQKESLLENRENKRTKYADADGNPISRKRMKKLRRINRRPEKSDSCKKSMDQCFQCVNPMGLKCEYKLCKQCCRNKCFIENLDCMGHRILVKTRRQMAQMYANRDKRS